MAEGLSQSLLRLSNITGQTRALAGMSEERKMQVVTHRVENFKLNPIVFTTAARCIESSQFVFPAVAIQAAAKSLCPATADVEEYVSAHVALLYYAHAPGTKRHMRCTRSELGARRWFSLGCDLRRATTDAHPWWSQRASETTPAIRGKRVAVLENLAQLSQKFILPDAGGSES